MISADGAFQFNTQQGIIVTGMAGWYSGARIDTSLILPTGNDNAPRTLPVRYWRLVYKPIANSVQT
jgi:hypothetical protein